MTLDDDEPAFTFRATCLGCHKVLEISGDFEDELRELFGASGWKMCPEEAMGDPIADPSDFLCPDCPVNYI
jgi:hypothetical protein